MTPLIIEKNLTHAPIVVANENLRDIFTHCSRQITKEGNRSFAEKQGAFAYPSFERLGPPFSAGEIWETANSQDHASMIATFVETSGKVLVMLQDNNPALPQSTRGRNILILTTGEYDLPAGFALLTKNAQLIDNFKKFFPGVPLVDPKAFAEPVYMPFGKIQGYMQHLVDGHVVGKVCSSCGRPGHHHDALTPQGLGFGSNQ